MLIITQTALELGFLYALVAMALFLSYRILDIADLTTDGGFVLGAAVSVTVTAAGHPVLAIFAAMLAGACAGFVTAFLQTKLGVPSILAGIVTNTGLYTVNLMAMGWKSNQSLLGGKTSFSETVKPNSKPTAPGSVPVKTGYTFKGWFTAKTGGSLYSTVTITSSTTFYAQFAANKYTVTWDLGIGQSETTEQTYGEKLLLPKDPERKNAEFLGWFTEKDGGTEVDSNTIYTTDGETTYYAHWEITEVFSVTVPVTLPLIVDESGEVHAGTAEIINGSTGEVVVSSVSISTKNGWQLVPYTTDMAHEKVDAQLLGFKINGAQTTKNGNAETFALSAPWEIAENSRMTLSYDAVVSAVSKAITEQEVLSVVFVLEWRGE